MKCIHLLLILNIDENTTFVLSTSVTNSYFLLIANTCHIFLNAIDYVNFQGLARVAIQGPTWVNF